MSIEDQFTSLKQSTSGIYKERGSKFIANIIPIQSDQEIPKLLSDIKKEHSGARHFCYAYVLGINREEFRVNDDGEPGGTAGLPILNQLLSQELTNVLAVVIRYFGGTKLGASGLKNAYKLATKNALKDAQKINGYLTKVFKISFPHLSIHEIFQVLKGYQCKIIDQKLDQTCILTFSIRLRDASAVAESLGKKSNLEIHIIEESQ